MKCPLCEQRIDDNASYCVFCGKVFDASRAGADEQARLERAAAAAAKLVVVAAPEVVPAASSDSPPRKISEGRILTEALQVWGANLVPFGVVSAIVTFPVAFAAAFMRTYVIAHHLTWADGWEQLATIILVTLPIEATFVQFATAVILYGVLEALGGRPVAIGRCLALGGSRALPAVGTAVAFSLTFFAAYLLFCVPGLWVLSALPLAVPVAVIERKGIADAFERSLALTRGNRVQTMIVLLVVFVARYLADQGRQLLVAAVPKAYAVPVDVTAQLLKLVFFTSLSATVSAVLYFRLRALREPVDADELVRVFD